MRPLGRPGHKPEDNIKMYLQEVVLGDMEWNDLADDIDRRWALMNAVMKIRVP